MVYNFIMMMTLDYTLDNEILLPPLFAVNNLRCLETRIMASAESSPELGAQPDKTELPSDASNSQASEDSDFGDFDDFGDFNEEEPFDGSKNNSEPSSTINNTNNDAQESTDHETPAINKLSLNHEGPKPLKSGDLYNMTDEQIRAQLVQPPHISDDADQETLKNGDTATSHQLWQHLTETTWMPLPKWDGSPIHRQLALSLGVPLNLDKTLPNKVTKRLDLPTLNKKEDDGMQNVFEWGLLSEVSNEALNHKSDTELEEHVGHLEQALRSASELRDSIEAKEMDLLGERNILEGMVESLLVFSQRNQREKLLRAKQK